MITLFQNGGPLFMGILTVILISLVSTAVYIGVQRKNENKLFPQQTGLRRSEFLDW
jgi:sorbitol-specific phosphotransferase system component IIC